MTRPHRENERQRGLRLLSACHRAALDASSEADMFARIVCACVEKGGYRLAWLALPPPRADGEFQVIAHAAANGASASSLPQLPAVCVKRVFESKGKLKLCSNVARSPTWQAWHAHARTHAYSKVGLLPLAEGGRIRGVLILHGDQFGTVARELLTQIAADLEYACAGFTARRRREQESRERFVRERTADGDYILEDVAGDITTRKSVEADLQRLATIVEQATVSIVMTDLDAAIIYANPYSESTTGYSRGELIGKNPRILQSGKQDREFYTELWETLTAGNTWNGRFINRRKDGGLYHEAATIFPIKNSHGEIINYAAVKRDISKEIEMEEALRNERKQLSRRVTERTAELRRANAELHRVVRLKDEFLATMSHELRTPLNSILTLAEVLEETLQAATTVKQQGYFHTLRDSAEHLLNLINDILDVSKIGAGQVQLELESVPLRVVCESSLSLMRQLAAKKRLSLKFIPAPEETAIEADSRRLKQILVNLLSNAVKFTPEGGHIELSVTPHPDRQTVRLCVADSGIGIREEDIARLFEPFVQLDTGLARHYSGTGLGLTLVARMAELHGGSVEVESTPGQGSRFSVLLPWTPHSGAEPMPPGTPAAEKVSSSCQTLLRGFKPHILVVDDTPHVRELLTEYFSRRGCKVRSAATGLEAVEQSLALKPDVILMDVQMPEMDGFEATRRIRGEPELADTLIIAITALAMPGDRERCLQAGMQDYISKPVALKELCYILVKHLRKKHGGIA